MISFGLVTEGITDQEILSNVLFGFFKETNIPINPFQPIRDETDKSRQGNFGGWLKVFEYCNSKYFRQAFQSCDYIIIQLDSDVCEEYGIPKFESGTELKVIDLINKIKTHLINEIGQEFYNKVVDKVIFAISVHSIECWFLPLFYTDNKRSKTTGCIGTLNRALETKNYGVFIDPDNKQFEIYQNLAKPLKKHKTLLKTYKHSPSFEVFYSDLAAKNINLGN